MHVYEVRPRIDRRGFDLVSDALPFGRLWYGEPNALDSIRRLGYRRILIRKAALMCAVSTDITCLFPGGTAASHTCRLWGAVIFCSRDAHEPWSARQHFSNTEAP